MKFSSILLLIFTMTSYGQVAFEKGYLIDNQGEKIDCLIKNTDRFDNLSSFSYKLKEDGEIIFGNISNVKEFGIGGFIKYTRASVSIDRSPMLDYTKAPKFSSETLFLKVLVSGRTTLLRYFEGETKRFFFKVGENNLEQLVYKKYYLNESQIQENNHYRQQLLLALPCENLPDSKLRKLKYQEDELISFFEAYNVCVGSDYIRYKEAKKKLLFNVKVRPGINFANFNINQTRSDRADAEFDLGSTFRIGIEAELYLNFNRNKWSILFEPSYQKFPDREATVLASAVTTDIASFSYSTIELSFGPRHHFYLNNDSKLFFNLLFSISLAQNSQITFNERVGFEIPNNSGFSAGLGYSFKDKYNIELRYNLPENPLNDVLLWDSTFTNFSILFGYTLFNTKK